jgi:hypothetical protein
MGNALNVTLMKVQNMAHREERHGKGYARLSLAVPHR